MASESRTWQVIGGGKLALWKLTEALAQLWPGKWHTSLRRFYSSSHFDANWLRNSDFLHSQVAAKFVGLELNSSVKTEFYN